MTSMEAPLVLPEPKMKNAGLYAGIGDYKKVEPKRYAPKTLRETAEGRYWRAYKAPSFINAVSQVTSLHFADAYPYQLAVTSSARVSHCCSIGPSRHCSSGRRLCATPSACALAASA